MTQFCLSSLKIQDLCFVGFFLLFNNTKRAATLFTQSINVTQTPLDRTMKTMKKSVQEKKKHNIEE